MNNRFENNTDKMIILPTVLNLDVGDEKQLDVDPLEGLDASTEEKYYKLDQIVFADPIENINILTETEEKVNNEFIFYDKVIKEKRKGKRNKYHIEMEVNTMPVCPETNCKKKFTTVTLLKAHVRKIHCAEHKFICDRCGASFTAKYLLARHMAVHEMQKVKCPICLKVLSKRTNLLMHIRFVHRQGELKCLICDQRIFLEHVFAST